jgi:hypothetical protein
MRFLFVLVALAAASAADFRVGVARVDITPATPVWLSGFAARTQPARGVLMPLMAKALALEDHNGGRFVIVTADLIGLTREIADAAAARLPTESRLERTHILFNASHTHSGPMVWPRLEVARASGPEVEKQVLAYRDLLIERLARVIENALQNLQPADIAFGAGEANFAYNRRTEQLAQLHPGKNFPAPVDREVPVLRVTGPSHRLRAVLFGYACHGTTLTANTNQVSGDFAGFAQAEFEARHPGTTAMFAILCGGDQRPTPRGTVELARRHGHTLTVAVDRVLSSPMMDLHGPLRVAWQSVELPFTAHTREQYEAEASSQDFFLARRGRAMLKALDAGHPVESTPLPIQAVRFGNGPALLALGGEAVVDYCLQLKREYGARRLIVAAYSNDLPGYIPTRRIQREGGYEAGDSLVYFVQPGWFTDEVEDLVFDGARHVLSEVGLEPVTPAAARPSDRPAPPAAREDNRR